MNPELLLADWLRFAVPTVADRVYVDTIEDTPIWPLVRIQLIGGSPSDTTYELHLDRPMFQIDVYGGTKEEARTLADAIRSALPSLVGSHEHGVVSGVNLGSMRSLPDVAYQPPRPRYILSVTLYVHP